MLLSSAGRSALCERSALSHHSAWRKYSAAPAPEVPHRSPVFFDCLFTFSCSPPATIIIYKLEAVQIMSPLPLPSKTLVLLVGKSACYLKEALSSCPFRQSNRMCVQSTPLYSTPLLSYYFFSVHLYRLPMM